MGSSMKQRLEGKGQEREQRRKIGEGKPEAVGAHRQEVEVMREGRSRGKLLHPASHYLPTCSIIIGLYA